MMESYEEWWSSDSHSFFDLFLSVLLKSIMMGYYIDLNQINIGEYKCALLSADLIPSRMPLKENIDYIFERIDSQNVMNVEELLNKIRTKDQIQQFSEQSNISKDYLTLLSREIRSNRQKPVRIKDFPNLTPEVIGKLIEIGLKNTRQLYDQVLTKEKRKQLSLQTDIEISEITQLTKLTDLSRIKWVNHTFAYVLYEAGFSTAERVAHADYKELYQRIKKMNEERNLYRGHIGLRDMKRCVEEAKNLTFEIEW